MDGDLVKSLRRPTSRIVSSLCPSSNYNTMQIWSHAIRHKKLSGHAASLHVNSRVSFVPQPIRLQMHRRLNLTALVLKTTFAMS